MTWLAIWAASLIGFVAGTLFKGMCDAHARRRREIDWQEASEEYF